MSRAKRKRAGAMNLVAQNADPKHGCEACRSPENRRELVDVLLARGGSTMQAECPKCGARWGLRIFANGPNQELHASFLPIQKKSAELN